VYILFFSFLTEGEKAKGLRPCVTFHKKVLSYGEFLAPRATTQGRGPPIVGCPRLLTQYIRSYPPYLEAVYLNHLMTML
jgi:hypothetical protein